LFLVLTEKNYDSMIRLVKISPVSLSKFRFVISKIILYKITLEHNKHYFMVAFEFIIYSKVSYFIRVLITESLTCRSYSRIFTPYYMHSYTSNVDELKKDLESNFKLGKKFLEDVNYKKKFKMLLNEIAMGILQKNLYLKQYDNIDVLLSNL
jgi:hypothetical protein